MIPFNHLGFVFKYTGALIYPAKVRQALCTFLKPLSRHVTVLDVGAGTGMLCEFAHKCRNDFIFTAVDPAEGMLKFSPEYVKTYQANAEDLPFDNESFEAILIGEALHHFEDVDKSLQEVVRVLKKDGKLFIYDFDVSRFMGRNICRVEKLLGEPGNFFEPEVLKVKLEALGFDVEVHQYGWRYTISAVLG